ncbi:MAG TPA: hypothetical protein DEB17_01015 [Chlorobaculum sp.]|nr:hypothetical protein [Chlorobaculum sp.]
MQMKKWAEWHEGVMSSESIGRMIMVVSSRILGYFLRRLMCRCILGLGFGVGQSMGCEPCSYADPHKKQK